MLKVVLVGFGGMLGSVLRYLMNLYVPKVLGAQFPFATLFVNILGGLLIGFVMGLSLYNKDFSPELRLFLTTGIAGGFTTFSAFSYETVQLLAPGTYSVAVLNICLNVFCSLAAVLLGRLLALFVVG